MWWRVIKVLILGWNHSRSGLQRKLHAYISRSELRKTCKNANKPRHSAVIKIQRRYTKEDNSNAACIFYSRTILKLLSSFSSFSPSSSIYLYSSSFPLSWDFLSLKDHFYFFFQHFVSMWKFINCWNRTRTLLTESHLVFLTSTSWKEKWCCTADEIELYLLILWAV